MSSSALGFLGFWASWTSGLTELAAQTCADALVRERPSIDAICARSDKSVLYDVAHKITLCANSYIAILSDSDHKARMSDLARSPKQIGTIVQRARKNRGWTQTQLGAKAGLRQETISLIETGNPAAKLETILAVLAALDLEFQVTQRSRSKAADFEDIF